MIQIIGSKLKVDPQAIVRMGNGLKNPSQKLKNSLKNQTTVEPNIAEFNIPNQKPKTYIRTTINIEKTSLFVSMSHKSYCHFSGQKLGGQGKILPQQKKGTQNNIKSDDDEIFKTILELFCPKKELQTEKMQKILNQKLDLFNRIQTSLRQISHKPDWKFSGSKECEMSKTRQVIPANQATATGKNLQFQTAKQLNQFLKGKSIPIHVKILHSLAHIEYNAFMSYMDTYCTFVQQHSKDLKSLLQDKKSYQFLETTARIAVDQCSHCLQLINRLNQLGYEYGEIPVITTLSRTISRTQGDLIGRIIMISIIHEGKGMEAVKKLKDKVRNSDRSDKISVKILQQIEKEEVYHYESGVKWLQHFIRVKYSKRKPELDPQQLFRWGLLNQIERINFQYGYKLNSAKITDSVIGDWKKQKI